MSEQFSAVAPTIEIPALVVFGLDVTGKAHASWFSGTEAEPAAKAAGLMSMAALPLTDDEQRVAAAGLPRGRVFGSGRAFVPFSKTAVYERLSELAKASGIEVPKPAPRAKDETATGASSDSTGQVAAAASKNLMQLANHHYPTDWPEIRLNSLVLVTEGPTHGWYEAVVIEDKGDDLFVLQWRDWPEEPRLTRRREHLALLPPECLGARA